MTETSAEVILANQARAHFAEALARMEELIKLGYEVELHWPSMRRFHSVQGLEADLRISRQRTEEL